MGRIEVTGKTIEEAKSKAAELLGIDEIDVMYEILENAKQGFLGINSKPYKIAAWKEGEEFTAEEKAPEIKKEEVKQAVKEEIKAETKKEENSSCPVETAKEFLNKTLTLMGAPADIEANLEGDTLNITLSGEKMGLVIGRRGETLDAVQYLTGIVVNKGREGYIKVTVDTENYREKRTKALEALADKVAAKVVKNRKNMTLEPMNPFERRVIHSKLQENDLVTTISVGEDPNRRIVVKLK